MISKKLIENNLKNNRDGFTTTLKGDTKRYVVAFTNNNKNPSISTLKNQEKIFWNAESLTVGGWVSDSGESFIDIGTTLDNKSDAIKLGKLFKQQAIFDLKSLKTIYINK